MVNRRRKAAVDDDQNRLEEIYEDIVGRKEFGAEEKTFEFFIPGDELPVNTFASTGTVLISKTPNES